MTTPSVSGKICVKCGVDCANQPRMKDSQGRYYCQPCYNQVRKQAGAGADAKQAADSAAPKQNRSSNRLDQLLASAPPVAAAMVCPSCGRAMQPGAVICTNCGYSVQSGRQVSATAVEKAAKASTGAAMWPIVVGLISIAFGLADAGLQILSTIAAFSGDGDVRMRAGVIPIILSLALAYAGLQLVMRRARGAKLVMQWAWIKTVLGLTCFSLMFVGTITSQTASDALAERFGLNDIGRAGLFLALAIEFIWYTGWALFIIVWFHRAAVQQEVERWG